MWRLTVAGVSAFAAAAVNAIAGGGTFITFPILTGPLGLSAKAANVTSTVGLWTGYAGSIAAAREDFRKLSPLLIWGYGITGAVGGVIGAALLLTTSTTSFRLLIPWLLLFSTLTLAAGPWIGAWSARHAGEVASVEPRFSAKIFPLLLVISIYNGYFGAGGGILLLAGLTIAGVGDTQQMNTLKVLIQITANATAVLVFLGAGIDWHIAMVMSFGAAIGGFAGMASARRIPAVYVRMIIVTIASALTVIYFTHVGS
jgi:uncharacterized membrane protein YfcA